MSDFNEARKKAEALIAPFAPKHKRVKIFVGFDVEPSVYADCTHCRTPEEALRATEEEDKMAKKWKK